MSNIELWFPTAIYKASEIISEKDNNKLIKRCLAVKEKVSRGGTHWMSPVYNTMNSYDLNTDKAFQPLINIVTHHVHEFTKAYGSDDKYKCSNAWVNVYKKGDYQEFHTHPKSIFSAVYFVKAPEGSGSLILSNPNCPDMLPIQNIREDNSLNFETCSYKPEPRSLIIFRSYISHMVKQGNHKEERISLAFNF